MDYLVFFGFLFLLALAEFREWRANRAPRWIERAHALAKSGEYEEALAWLARVEKAGPEPWRVAGRFTEMCARADLGETATALRLAGSLLDTMSESSGDACPWLQLNLIVVTFVNGGSYHRAVSAAERWTAEQRERGREKDPDAYVLVRINEAEALGNLGRIEEALKRLEEVREAAEASPFALAGLLTLRAWILLQAGRVDEAREALEETDLSVLVPLYEPEVEYTRAALERDSGNLEAAMTHARRGLAAARRAASRRNGLFMVAGIAALQGEPGEARRLFEQGAGQRYRAQAGEGLTRYARFLEDRGEPEQAARVGKLIAERDPEWRAPG